ncbi:MAG: S8 family peptidase [Blastocatellia bacterium]
MPRDLEHLELPEWRASLPRRKRGGGRPPERDRRAHGQVLIAQVAELANHLQQRRQTSPQGINPKFVFKLQLHSQGNLDEEELRRMGLRLLARSARRLIVVFPDEATLNELRNRLRSYARQEQYANIAMIEAISELGPQDRVGMRLKASPLSENEVAALDIELWHSNDRNECRQRINELEVFLRRQGQALTDSWIGESLCLVRARVNSNVLEAMLEIDYIKEIDRRPEPTFEMLDVARLDVAQINVEAQIPDDVAGVLIIDSGVMQQHPLIGPALNDAQVFPDSLRERIRGGAEDGDQSSGGHGTAVAGIAAYNDVGECMANRVFRASARLFSARVTDDNNEYDENELLEHQLEEAIEYFLNNYPSVKVINISLGDSKLIYSDGDYQFRFAAAIDDLAYRHREREVVFVVSAGNQFPNLISDEEMVENYPSYLLSNKSRIIDPATSAIALTVGGLSYGAGRDLQQLHEIGVERLVAGERGWPSPFTRTGFGVDGSIKPEVVDFAGDMRFERGRVIAENPAYAGLPTTAKDFGPPAGRLFRVVAGTSFAAPRIANLAARLFKEFPLASSNLIRALIAGSAKIPQSRPRYFSGKQLWDEDVLRVYGYGQPDFERARWSDANEVLLLTDSAIEVDSFQIFTIPSLPPEFLTARGSGLISVTLAFDPPTRHTRGDSYLGITMEFLLFRNTAPETIAEALRAWDCEEVANLDEEGIPALGNINQCLLALKPGRNLRKKGTLQRAFLRVSRANWSYDGNPLQLAVICQRKWAPVDITHQRFAVAVSLSHEDVSVDIHARARQQARVYQRIRVKV